MVRLNRNNLDEFIKGVALSVLGIFCCLYFLFWSNFAELNIQLSFLPFPIFVGEILLFICLSLLAVKFIISRPKFIIKLTPPITFLKSNWQYLLLIFFFGSILIKALWGYSKWGGLALRNAALFYYALFAVIGYCFYSEKFFKNRFVSFALLALLVGIIFLRAGYKTYYFTYFILTLILFMEIKRKILRYIFIGLFIVVGYRNIMVMFVGGKNVLISSLVSYIFLLIILTTHFVKIKSMYKKLLSLFIVFVIPVVVWFIGGNQTAIKSLINLQKLALSYREVSKIVEEKKGQFEFSNPSVKIYETKEAFKDMAKTQGTSAPIDRSSETLLQRTLIFKDYESRPVELIQENILYRLFIWKDMLEELFISKKIFGLDFGKPFRSKTIEILKWDEGWKYRVGWVEPHNAYVHMIYRAGVIGIVFIIVIWTLFVKMVMLFIKIRDIRGILLASILLYWLIIANFMVILELPHWAIPFWCLFGMTLRYCHVKNSLYVKSLSMM